jgi:DNA polymerase-3 subunit gamma/tau
MTETLYRKYRPKIFSEIIGQTHIVRTLSGEIKHNRISHAYLFTGSRGTGKTTFARIFAKTINCENIKNDDVSLVVNSCENCQACKAIQNKQTLDILEIDAASNTGVDNIRELKETINLPPTFLKYKVYIIDEVHMLSTGAFNALLKTLEEPPAHAIFILATTEIHKVPETIVSRCQRFDFPRLPMPDIIEKLTLIATKEKIAIEKEAIEMIALSAEGGFRDAESLLGQIFLTENKNITTKEVEELLGITDKNFIFNITDDIVTKKTALAIRKINEITSAGYNLQIFAKALINHFRHLMLLKIDPDFSNFLIREMTTEKIKRISEQAEKIDLAEIISTINFFLEAQNKIQVFLLPQLALEIAIIKTTKKLPALALAMEQKITMEKTNKPTTSPKQTISTISMQNSTESPTPDISEKINLSNSEPTLKLTPAISLDKELLKNNWEQLLVEIRPHNHSLCASLSTCQIVTAKGDLITLATPYDFYKEKLSNPQNRLTIEEVFSKILGLAVRIEIITDKNLAPIQSSCAEEEINQATAHEKEKHEQSSLLNSAMEIMGGKIVE